MRRKLNRELLRRVARKPRRLKHEEHFNQAAWFDSTSCGTAACIAGHTVMIEGWRPVPERNFPTEHCIKNGRRRKIQDVAAEALGLSRDTDLFQTFPELHWPEEYAERWQAAQYGAERPSRIAADLLEALADGKVTL